MIEAEKARDGGDALGVGKQAVEYELAGEASEERALVVALDEGASVLDEFAVLDRGRANGLAGAAVEAFVDVIDEGIGDGCGLLRGVRGVAWAAAGEFGLGDVDHLVNAAAGGVGFEVPESVGGAGVEAEAAVDAAGVVLVDGVLAWDGRSSGRWLGGHELG